MALANLFLIGSIKSGTSSLSKCLSLHDDIYVPRIKELHFFSDLVETKRNTNNTDWLKTVHKHSLKVKSKHTYNEIFSHNKGEKYLLDASPTYCIDADALQKIVRYNPNAKVILFVREPLERLKSHLNMTLTSQNKSVKKLLSDSGPYQFENGMHLSYSRYHNMLKNLSKIFDSSKVMIVESHAFFSNQYEVLSKIYEWLEIESNKHSQKIIHANSYILPRGWKWLRYLFSYLKLPEKSKMVIRRVFTKVQKVDIDLPIEIEKELIEDYSKALKMKKYFKWIE